MPRPSNPSLVQDMDQRRTNDQRTCRRPQYPRRTQIPQRRGNEETHRRDPGLRKHAGAEGAQQSHDDFVGVDLSSYAGEIFDHIQGVASEDVKPPQDHDTSRLQVEAVDLFHEASRQLHQHFTDRNPDVPSLKRRNAIRRSRNARKTLLHSHHAQGTDEAPDTALQSTQDSLRLVEHHNTETGTQIHGSHRPLSLINDQIRLRRLALNREHTYVNSPADDIQIIPRPLSPCPEEEDDPVSPTSCTPSLRAGSISTISSSTPSPCSIGYAQVVQLDSSATASFIDVTSISCTLEMACDQEDFEEEINGGAGGVQIRPVKTPCSAGSNNELILQESGKVDTTNRPTKTALSSTIAATEDLDVAIDGLSIARTSTNQPLHARELSTGKEVTARDSLRFRDPVQVYRIGNLPEFMPCLPLDNSPQQESPAFCPRCTTEALSVSPHGTRAAAASTSSSELFAS